MNMANDFTKFCFVLFRSRWVNDDPDASNKEIMELLYLLEYKSHFLWKIFHSKVGDVTYTLEIYIFRL